MEIFLSVLLGVALGATSGLRIFVPFLVMSVATRLGYLEPSSTFEWVASTPALIAFSVAALLEIAAYAIPYVDNLLSTISVPVSAVAGTVLTMSVITEIDPLLAWTLSIVGGGGASVLTNISSNVLHAGSTVTTGGIANPFVSLGESVLSFIMAVLAVLFPLLVLIIVVIAIILILKRWRTCRSTVR